MSTTPLTRHVTRLYRETSEATRLAGAEWYADAYETAHDMAIRFDVPLHVAAGVLAATSPLNSWRANVSLAERILSTRDTSSGYLLVGLRKAASILEGTEPIKVLISQKVRNFYLAIVTRGADGVCIDRHAWDIATNTRNSDASRPGVSGRRYDRAAECYRRAAVILSEELGYPISPAAVQATTWIEWRNRHWAPGAYDPKAGA